MEGDLDKEIEANLSCFLIHRFIYYVFPLPLESLLVDFAIVQFLAVYFDLVTDILVLPLDVNEG